ncbi:MAG: helix-turn-helix transcriptional regulator [Rhodococcus sp. (in: high G+C Gram-positive bacteria)]
MGDNGLGSFLKCRRDAISPTAAGIASFGQRRVAGLRREEVSMLAGLSVDYYTRLEQGRERHPSASVLDSFARVFSLSDDQREHMFRLAETALPVRVSQARARVDPGLLSLMNDWPHNPAVVVSRTLDVLARNMIADALFEGLAVSDNIVEKIFLDPRAHTLYRDWVTVAESAVASLRLAEGFAPEDARLRELVSSLAASSPDFVALWERQDVRGKTSEPKEFHHSEVGNLDLTYQAFDIRSAPDQQLIVYRAAPGSVSAQALRLLGSLAATGVHVS